MTSLARHQEHALSDTKSTPDKSAFIMGSGPMRSPRVETLQLANARSELFSIRVTDTNPPNVLRFDHGSFSRPEGFVRLGHALRWPLYAFPRFESDDSAEGKGVGTIRSRAKARGGGAPPAHRLMKECFSTVPYFVPPHCHKWAQLVIVARTKDAQLLARGINNIGNHRI